jgi:hypothetical protein
MDETTRKRRGSEMRSKRRRRGEFNPQRIVIQSDVDRAASILEDPDAYFEEARRRAREQVVRDLERERMVDGRLASA